MQSDNDSHEDLAAYVMGRLDAEGRASFEEHLGRCQACREEVAELGPLAVAMEDVAEPFEVPADLAEKVLAAVDVAAATAPAPAVAGPSRPAAEKRSWLGLRPRLALAGAALAVAAIALAVGLRSGDENAAGPVEVDGILLSASGAPEGDLLVTAFDTGREVRFTSEELPILPTGDYYELWFVAPGDSPSDPNRVSAGTFHPDEKGITDVVLHAAVDPTLFARVEVTSEPGDGDPAPSGKVVAELPADDFLPDP